MREAVTLHNDLLRRLLRQHRGYESVFLRGNAAGEGYFCLVFSRPVDALRWFVFLSTFSLRVCSHDTSRRCGEVQHELLKVSWPQDLLECDYAQEESAADGSVLFRGLRVRMGVHYGPTSRARDPLSHRYEYFGAGVKVATELTLRAEGGHVLVSDAAISATEAVISRDRFIKVGAIDVVLTNGGSMVEVHDMLLDGLEERCPGWEPNATDDPKSCTRDTGSAAGSSGAGSTDVRASRSPRPLPGDEPSSPAFIGSSNACRWIIPFEDLAIQEAYVGQGSYGYVSQGQWTGVTVKRFVKQRLDEDTMLRFREEAAMLAELRHPNVVLFIGACIRSPNVCIVTEWIRKGSLRDVLADGSAKLPWSTRLGVVKGIALGLAYRHSQEPAPILHRDLKSSNVLIDESWNAKICDFGLARMKEENATKLP